MIEWKDYGLPTDSDRAADQITAAFARARRGDVVEIGCLGGLGRTGTVLACMAVLADVPPASAVEWVRNEYNPAAVETDAQEEWVRWFADRLHDG
jgi:protein-tyrosine phosphatase